MEKTGKKRIRKNPENPDPDFPDFLPTFLTQNLAVNRKCKASFFYLGLRLGTRGQETSLKGDF